jgi:hypothetical protein
MPKGDGATSGELSAPQEDSGSEMRQVSGNGSHVSIYLLAAVPPS